MSEAPAKRPKLDGKEEGKQLAFQNDTGETSNSSTGKSEHTEETSLALEEIDSCQTDIDQLNEKASEEILKVEQKYNGLRKPLFEKRNDIISRIPNFWIISVSV